MYISLHKQLFRRILIASTVGTLLLAVSSCGPSDTSGSNAQNQSDSPVQWATYDDAAVTGTGDALFSGNLVLKSGCLYIDGGPGFLQLPVFPRSTTSFADDTLTFTAFSGNEVSAEINDEVAFGGGVIATENVDFATIPKVCDSKVMQVFSVGS